VKCGQKVTKLKEGDRVAIEPGIPCYKCTLCLSGRYNLCDKMVFHATPPYDGTLCQYINHPESFCHKLPSNVSNEEGALIEPLSVGVHACSRANVTLGSKVLIIGAGPIGLVNILAARSFGADTIVIVDIDENRLKLAKQIGADFTIQTKQNDDSKDVVAQIRQHLNDRLVDKTIECSGASNAVSLAIDATTSGGCVVIVGVGAPIISVPLLSALIREVDIRGVFRYANCYPRALSLLAQKRIDVTPLITHRFSFTESENAFKTVKSGKAVKVMIEIGRV